MNKMQVIYAQEEFPSNFTSSIFLAGPSKRKEYQNDEPSWRRQALQMLDMIGYQGVVFVPEPRSGEWNQEESTYSKQIEFEEKAMNLADCILFYVNRKIPELMGLTTNVEFGVWQESGKVVLAFPDDAEKMRYLEYYAKKLNVPIFNNLYLALASIVLKLGVGALRSGTGETSVNLEVWNNPSFQTWYKQLKNNGNRLDDTKLLWGSRMKSSGKLFAFALWTKIWNTVENRYKENEFVITRPDISSCVLFYRDQSANAPIGNTQILMVKEFRSPVNNSEGLVCEIPGGSSFKPTDNESTVLAEIEEETGLKFSSDRIKYIGSRQIYSTLLTHKAHIYSIELNQFEVSLIQSREGQTYGNAQDTEMTYPKIVTLRDILNSENVDWSNIGYIMEALTK